MKRSGHGDHRGTVAAKGMTHVGETREIQSGDTGGIHTEVDPFPITDVQRHRDNLVGHKVFDGRTITGQAPVVEIQSDKTDQVQSGGAFDKFRGWC